ncbi:MAG TPA: universal stress protein [Chthonomonadales bacterium]|nr:universal stress protein [Chthonomonadales bacterium]
MSEKEPRLFRRILVASDGSDGALKAARWAAVLARSIGAEVTVLHVFTMPTAFAPIVGVGGQILDAASIAQYAEEVQNAVARRTGHVVEEEGVPYSTRLEIGHPAGTIVRIADEEGFDLIVLGSRGLTELKSFMLGSVSDRVSHHAHCPVLIVK